jgi:hypothetical protein
MLVCGSREMHDRSCVAAVLKTYAGSASTTTLIHGAARGADTLAAEVGRFLGFTVQAFPAAWGELGRSAGMIRNQQMLEQKPDLVVAFFVAGAANIGTKGMVRIARKAGVPVVEVTSTKGAWFYGTAMFD